LKVSPTFPVFLVCILDLSSLPARGQSALELGIDRSNLTKASGSTQQKTVEGIRSLHGKWFPDVLSAAGTPEALDKFVNEVRLVKQNNLKMLVNVLPSYMDYDEPFANAGDEFKKMCGWSGGDGKLSQINLTKFTRSPACGDTRNSVRSVDCSSSRRMRWYEARSYGLKL
jgi:hypothetical protein